MGRGSYSGYRIRAKAVMSTRKHLIKTRGLDVYYTDCGLSFAAGHRSLVSTPAETTCKECLGCDVVDVVLDRRAQRVVVGL